MKTLINEMVSRFLGWRLPANFAPDAGMKFVPGPLQQPDGPCWPSGTNLLDATQARQMFEHCTSGPAVSRLIDRLQAAEAERDALAAKLADAERDREKIQPAHDAPIRFFCHSEDAGYNEFDTLEKALECAESMLTDARGNAQFDGEWCEEETAIRYGAVIGEAVEVRTDEGSYDYFISRPGSHPPPTGEWDSLERRWHHGEASPESFD